MTTITVPASQTQTQTTAGRSGLASWPVSLVGLVSGLAAAAAAVLVVVIARAAGVPMEAGPVYYPHGELIPLEGFASITLMSTAIGTVLAMAIARWAKRPVRTFLIVTIVLTLVSFAAPHTTHYATAATRIVLDLTHVVAAAIVIPALAWRLAQVHRSR